MSAHSHLGSCEQLLAQMIAYDTSFNLLVDCEVAPERERLLLASHLDTVGVHA